MALEIILPKLTEAMKRAGIIHPQQMLKHAHPYEGMLEISWVPFASRQTTEPWKKISVDFGNFALARQAASEAREIRRTGFPFEQICNSDTPEPTQW